MARCSWNVPKPRQLPNSLYVTNAGDSPDRPCVPVSLKPLCRSVGALRQTARADVEPRPSLPTPRADPGVGPAALGALCGRQAGRAVLPLGPRPIVPAVMTCPTQDASLWRPLPACHLLRGLCYSPRRKAGGSGAAGAPQEGPLRSPWAVSSRDGLSSPGGRPLTGS